MYVILTERQSIECRRTIQLSCLHRSDLFDYNRNIVCFRSAKRVRAKFSDFYHLVSFALPPYLRTFFVSSHTAHLALYDNFALSFRCCTFAVFLLTLCCRQFSFNFVSNLLRTFISGCYVFRLLHRNFFSFFGFVVFGFVIYLFFWILTLSMTYTSKQLFFLKRNTKRLFDFPNERQNFVKSGETDLSIRSIASHGYFLFLSAFALKHNFKEKGSLSTNKNN